MQASPLQAKHLNLSEASYQKAYLRREMGWYSRRAAPV